MESCSKRAVCKRITFSQKFDISLCSCMVNGIWIACSKFLRSTPIYQEVTFDLLLTKICVVVNRDLANYLWKREFSVAEMAQYSFQHFWMISSRILLSLNILNCLDAFCTDWMISSYLLGTQGTIAVQWTIMVILMLYIPCWIMNERFLIELEFYRNLL